jgi:hypothetical protein
MDHSAVNITKSFLAQYNTRVPWQIIATNGYPLPYPTQDTNWEALNIALQSGQQVSVYNYIMETSGPQPKTWREFLCVVMDNIPEVFPTLAVTYYNHTSIPVIGRVSPSQSRSIKSLEADILCRFGQQTVSVLDLIESDDPIQLWNTPLWSYVYLVQGDSNIDASMFQEDLHDMAKQFRTDQIRSSHRKPNTNISVREKWAFIRESLINNVHTGDTLFLIIGDSTNPWTELFKSLEQYVPDLFNDLWLTNGNVGICLGNLDTYPIKFQELRLNRQDVQQVTTGSLLRIVYRRPTIQLDVVDANDDLPPLEGDDDARIDPCQELSRYITEDPQAFFDQVLADYHPDYLSDLMYEAVEQGVKEASFKHEENFHPGMLSSYREVILKHVNDALDQKEAEWQQRLTRWGV